MIKRIVVVSPASRMLRTRVKLAVALGEVEVRAVADVESCKEVDRHGDPHHDEAGGSDHAHDDRP